MIKLKNAQGILSTEVPTGNLLWVDAVNGVDALAKRGRMTIPFRSLSNAKDAALSGDTIVVLPGVYDEAGLAKDGVSWYFEPGAVIASTASVNVFDDGGNPVSYDIDGFGVIGSTGANVGVFRIANSGSRVRIRCRELKGTLYPGYSLIRIEAGDVGVECHRMELDSYGRAISVADGEIHARVEKMHSGDEECISQGDGTLYLTVQQMTSAASYGIRCSGGTCHVLVGTIDTPANYCLEVMGGVVFCTAQRLTGDHTAVSVIGGECTVRAELIEATDSVVQQVDNHVCRVFGARIVGDIPVNIEGMGMYLNNCWLVGGSYSIGTDFSGDVVCLACGGNVAKSGDVTVLPSTDELTIDSNYT